MLHKHIKIFILKIDIQKTFLIMQEKWYTY